MRRIMALKNMKISFIFYIINIIITFLSKSIFMYYIGATYLGFQSVILGLLNILNLAEMGVSSAIGYALYKPLGEKDNSKINDIMLLFKYYYNKIGMIIIVLGLIMSLVLPSLIKNQIDIKIAYYYFYIYLFNNAINYFISYKHTLFSADQKQYIITYVQSLMKIIKIIIQMVALIIYKSFFMWVMLEVIFNILTVGILNIKVKKEYNEINFKLNTDINRIKQDNMNIISDIKNVFFHKFAGVVVYQTDSILISYYLTLTQTAIYSSYMMIINNVIGLISNVLGSISATVGNLITEGNDEKSYNVWLKLFYIDYTIATLVCFTLYKTINIFVSIWMGNDFVFEQSIVIVLLINLFIQITRQSTLKFKLGYGIFSDVYAPLIEGLINLIVSIILVNKIGIIGIFIGTLASNIAIVILWQPYVLFKKGFKMSISKYINEYIYLIFSTILTFNISNNIIDNTINRIIMSDIKIMNLIIIAIFSLAFTGSIYLVFLLLRNTSRKIILNEVFKPIMLKFKLKIN